MAAVGKKPKSQRKIAAFNFLSNISLDGSHKDTKYGLFKNRRISRGTVASVCHSDNSENERKKNRPSADEKDVAATDISTSLQPQTSDAAFNEIKSHQSNDSKISPVTKKRSEVLTEGVDNENNIENKWCGDSPSKRHRANSLSDVEKKPSVRRRRLFTSLSISEDASPPEAPCVGSLSDHNPLSVGSVRSRHRSTSSSGSLTSSSRSTLHMAHKDIACLKPHFRHKTKRDRVVLVTPKKAPFVIFSHLPYSKWSQQGHIRGELKQKLNIVEGSTETLRALGLDRKIEDGQDVSYNQFLVPSSQSATKKTPRVSQVVPPDVYFNTEPLTSPEREPSLDHYSHDLLDDPELRSGKHRTLLTFTSYMTSVIDYARPSDLKKELNEKFRNKFPYIQLSLSKLRSLKQDMKKVANIKLGLDLWVVAQAYVYFEKVILKGFLTKPVRRLCAGACLMLSAKMNDVKGTELTKLIDEVEDFFKLNRRELLATEFGVLVALEFSLLVPDSEVKPHHQRLIYTS